MPGVGVGLGVGGAPATNAVTADIDKAMSVPGPASAADITYSLSAVSCTAAVIVPLPSKTNVPRWVGSSVEL